MNPITLDSLLAPRSVALIGASNRAGSLGHDMVQMIMDGGYEGAIYPINPRYETVCNLRCNESLEAIGEPVDLAVICVAAHRAEAQVDAAIKAGARALVLFANAIIEEDSTPALAERIAAKCEAAGIPLLGHNAMGFYNNDLDLRVCGFKAPDAGIRGHISLITQSGSVFSTLCHNEPQLKYNLAIANGAETTTCSADFMHFALEQPSTRVIGLYLESVRKPALFVDALKKAAERNMPVVVMKVGRSELGAQFALSHSGGMAGDDDALQTVLDHYGAIRVDSLDEMANTLLLFSEFPELSQQGGLMTVVDSGGERNLLADEAEVVGLEFARLSDEIHQQLQTIQDYGQEADNPLDAWGTGIEFERIFGESLGTMLKDDNAAMGLMSQDIRDGYFLTDGLVEAIAIAQKISGKPIAFMTHFTGTRRNETTARLNRMGVPVLAGTRASLQAIKHRLDRRHFRLQSETVEPVTLNNPTLSRQGLLQEYEALALLKEFGVPTVPSYRISSAAELEKIQPQLSYPVVLKTAQEGILHKADVGGVILHLSDFKALSNAYRDLCDRLGPEALIQPMQKLERELIFGMKTDPSFGPLVIVGAGGILAEYLDDKLFLLPGASTEEIRSKLEALRLYPILQGVRGAKPVDIEALIDAIANFCRLAGLLAGSVREIDINPVMVSEAGVQALDALIVGQH